MIKIKKSWFMIGLLGILLAAPNAMVIKHTVNDIDPFLFNTLRFLLIVVVTAPFLLINKNKFTRYNLWHALQAGVLMSIAVVSFVWAIRLSRASYVSIITLITPIVFVVYAAKLGGEKITRRAAAGITLAAIGAMTIVVLPVAINQGGDFVFYPWATVVALVNSAVFPLSVINFKKSNEAGLPMPALMAVSALIVFVVNAVCYILFGDAQQSLAGSAVLGIMYSGVIVALLARVLIIASYEHVGAIISSALAYLETFIAILLPVMILNEKLSIEMVVGGILILCGVYVVEHHKSAHHKHHLLFKGH